MRITGGLAQFGRDSAELQLCNPNRLLYFYRRTQLRMPKLTQTTHVSCDLQNPQMTNLLLNIATLGLKSVYDKHRNFCQLITNFRNKLPRQQNTARKLTDTELESHPGLSGLKYMNVVDLATQKTTVSEADIDQFYNELNHFDFRFMLFPKYYKGIVRNLNRFNPKADNKNFDLFMIQQVLKEDPLHPIKPVDVILFNLKWHFKPTSSTYVWFLKRTKRGRHMRAHRS